MFIDMDTLDAETQRRIDNLGFLQVNPEAAEWLDRDNTDILLLFQRFTQGDYGVLNHNKELAFQSDLAMYQQKGECTGEYELPSGRHVRVTTRWNQPVTIVEEVE